MNEYQRLDAAPIKQHTDKPLLLFHGAQPTVNSVRCHQARSKTGGSVLGREYQLLWRAGLVVTGQGYGA
jgi:hypothetical protein